MKILTVVGARPQFIKAAALSPKIRSHHKEVLLHTGQHFDNGMSDVFFEEMGIPVPDYNLNISGGTHGQMTGRMLEKIEQVIMMERPDSVLVYGDTNSTLSGALAAVKLHTPVIHVEAGLRVGTLDSPEEVNRVLTDHISSIKFCVTESGMKNLEREGIDGHSYVVGNVMYDSFVAFAEKANGRKDGIMVSGLDHTEVEVPRCYYLLTCHREENSGSDEPMTEIFEAMETLDAPTIYPVHPRNQKRALRLVSENHYKKIILISPVKYSDSVWLVSHAKKIVTDSGGLQCEAFYAGRQCVTILDFVAWPETMVDNRNQLCRPDREDIVKKLSSDQTIVESYRPFGDGHTADRILQVLDSVLV